MWLSVLEYADDKVHNTNEFDSWFTATERLDSNVLVYDFYVVRCCDYHDPHSFPKPRFCDLDAFLRTTC